MSGDQPANKGAGDVAGSSAGLPGPNVSMQDMIAAAVAAALQAAGVVAIDPAKFPPKPEVETTDNLPADAAEEAEIAAVEADHREKDRSADLLVNDLIPLIMQERHLLVFRWLAAARGVSQGELLRQIVRNEIARETPNWREAQGKGGKSTKSAATMARLKGDE